MSPATTFSRIWNLTPSTLSELRRDFDRACESVSRGTAAAWQKIPMAVWESTDGVRVELDVPGLTREQIEITIEGAELTVKATRTAPAYEATLRHSEPCFGELQRTITLAETLDPQQVTAELENGVLQLCIPRRVEAKPTRVAISIKSPEAGS